MNKRGLSDIVTNVLIILLVLVAIGIIWFFVQPFIQSAAGGLEGTEDCLTLSLEPTRCTVNGNNYNVSFKRNAGDGELKGVTFTFNDAQGNAVVNRTLAAAYLPSQLESRTYVANVPGGPYTKVSVAAVVTTSSPDGRQCEPRATPVVCA